jgi:hypothetical protein
MSVKILHFKHSICDTNLLVFMTILYIWLRVSCIGIIIMVQFTVSGNVWKNTFIAVGRREMLEI